VIEAVLFDFAGTVMMPLPGDELVAAAVRELGLSLDDDAFDRLAASYVSAGIPGGPYPDGIPDDLADLYAARDLTADAHRGAYIGLMSRVPGSPAGLPEAVYAEILKPTGWVPYADAVPVVATLVERGIRVGALSNIGFDMRPILRAHGLDALAEHSTLSYEVHAVKPDPEIFRLAMETVAGTSATTLMVGDNEEADTGGVQIGMPTLILPMTAPRSVHGLDRVLRRIDQ
jgi:FMN phosphatase YigB (HAD superfamily)